MNRVIETCLLTADEEFRLRAAMITTSVEAMLMDRIPQDDALKAAERILPVTEGAPRTHVNELTGIGEFKRGEASMPEDTYTALDVALEPALDAIERATIELHLSLFVSPATERLRRLRQARDGFAAAVVLLNEADPAIKASEAWHEWYEEAMSSFQSVAQRVVELERENPLVDRGHS